MHGAHPFEGPMRLWWGHFEGQVPVTEPGGNSSSLFSPVRSNGTIDPKRMFKAGGAITEAGLIDRSALHDRIRLLSQLLSLRELGEDGATPPHSGIPAGYTYLMQFIAHDMIDSVFGLEVGREGVVATRHNARIRPLMLETLYGSGPDEAPHAYAIDRLDDAAGPPRVRLRVGKQTAPAFVTRSCPFRDLARGWTRPDWSEDEALKRPFEAGEELRTEAFVADPRNDSHSLIAQLTVLFVLLHNNVVKRLSKLPKPTIEIVPGITSDQVVLREQEYRIFLCARIIVTEIYRRIVFDDLLKRILDPRILTRYQAEKKPLLDGGEGIPLEFTFGAFRFGHALVRAKYKINSEGEVATSGALQLGSANNPRRPISDEWLVDWQRFFFEEDPGTAAEGHPSRNFGRCLAPSYSDGLNGSQFDPKVPMLDTSGLMSRDLLSSAYAGLISVEALIEKLVTVFGDDKVRPRFDLPASAGVLHDLQARGRSEQQLGAQPAAGTDERNGPHLPSVYELWSGKLLKELTRLRDSLTGGGRPEGLLAEPLEPIAKDPPLPYFVLAEARFGSTVENGAAIPINGRRLGPIGSIIVAETFYGAASAHPLVKDAGLPDALDARLRTYAGLFFPSSAQQAAHELADVIDADITSMPKLIDFLATCGEFPQPGSPSPAGPGPEEDDMPTDATLSSVELLPDEPPTFERVEIAADAELVWGLLVRTWATGVSHFPSFGSALTVSIDKLQPPRTRADLERQLRLVGIHGMVTIPERFTSVAVIQYSPNVLTVRLPPRSMVKTAAEALTRGTLDYAIGTFYTDLGLRVPTEVNKKIELQTCRIGEYAINSCM